MTDIAEGPTRGGMSGGSTAAGELPSLPPQPQRSAARESAIDGNRKEWVMGSAHSEMCGAGFHTDQVS
jgi:hypothetical protein